MLWSKIGNSLKQLKNEMTIYDPCCGKNKRILNYFNDLNFKAEGSDLYYGEKLIDVFDLQPFDKNTIIITNTPYKELSKFITKIKSICNNFIMLIPTYAIHYRPITDLCLSNKCMIISCGRDLPFTHPDGKISTIKYGCVWFVYGSAFELNKEVHVIPFVSYDSNDFYRKEEEDVKEQVEAVKEEAVKETMEVEAVKQEADEEEFEVEVIENEEEVVKAKAKKSAKKRTNKKLSF